MIGREENQRENHIGKSEEEGIEGRRIKVGTDKDGMKDKER